MNDDTIRVGIFGVGTVGAGVIELLSENRTVIEKRAGKPVKAVKAVKAEEAEVVENKPSDSESKYKKKQRRSRSS